jgi:actin-related protein
MCTEAVWNPMKNRVKMAQCLFEKFGFAAMQIGV